jgi:hypothetical protein
MNKTTLRLTTLITLLLLMTGHCMAQDKTLMATLYPQFKPAVIKLTDGRTITNSLTNVFLKNSSLLYMHNTYTMEANMDNIVKVDFDDRSFVNIKNQLATVVDTVGSNVLYRIDYLDIDAYKTNLKNNMQLSNFSVTDFVNVDAVDLSNEEDRKLPLVHKYYMLYNGKLVFVHERDIQRELNKEQKRRFKTIISMPDFTWVDDACVLRLLRAISD